MTAEDRMALIVLLSLGFSIPLTVCFSAMLGWMGKPEENEFD
jgi:hypothetical protein